MVGTFGHFIDPSLLPHEFQTPSQEALLASFPRPRALLTLLVVSPVLSACDSITDSPAEQESYPVVAEQLQNQFGEQVTDFRLRELNVGDLADQMNQGRVELTVVSADNSLATIELDARSVQLRAPGLEEGVLRSGSTIQPSVQMVPLPPEQNYVLGDCEGGEALRCGGLAVLDDARTKVGGVVMHPDVGTTFIQPVEILLDDLPEGTPEGLHVLYHQDNTEPLSFPDDEALVQETPGSVRQKAESSVLADHHNATGKSTGVVLDGDVEFYEQDPSTVWARQQVNMLITWLAFAIGEPVSGSTHSWGLDLEIKGQEVWVQGGPTTTDAAALVEDVLGDPDYFTIHSVNSDEMLIFFVGYEVGHVRYYGRAGGIPGAGSWNSTEFGGGPANNRAWVKDMPRLSLNTVWGVSMHEVGHLLGGVHGDGCSGCTSGSFGGASIMLAGKATLDTRTPFFTDENDARIAQILNNVLPWSHTLEREAVTAYK